MSETAPSLISSAGPSAASDQTEKSASKQPAKGRKGKAAAERDAENFRFKKNQAFDAKRQAELA